MVVLAGLTPVTATAVPATATAPTPAAAPRSVTATAVADRSQSRIGVVAAEDSWGSLAAQLGGNRVDVLSVLTDPNADPHEYESTPATARAIARARLVVVNGVGYDDWALQMLAAQPEPRRRVLDVGSLLGKVAGQNPHLWYRPGAVSRVVDRITAAYESLDPAHRAYYAARHRVVEAALRPYRERLAAMRRHFAGRTIGATESLVGYLAASIGLRVVTPPAFMRAVAEGSDPPARDVATFYRQIRAGAFGVLAYNRQTVTPLTTALREATARKGIAVVGFSETMPPGSTFERWMDRQLGDLARALRRSGPSAPTAGAAS